MSTPRMMLVFVSLLSVLLAALPHLVWVVCRLVARIGGHTVPYAPFAWTVAGSLVLLWAVMAYGYFIGRWRLAVVEVPYENAEVPPAFDGFRIVHISDLHLSTFDDNPGQLRRFVDAINGCRPDLICFTGDLVTMGRAEAEPYAATLRSLNARYGVVSVLGNHDFLIYEPSLAADDSARAAAVEELAAFEREELGWRLLRDAHWEITAADGSKITIIGVDNKNCSNQGFRTVDAGNLDKAMAGTDGFRILLSHDPSHWDAEVLPRTDIPLTLSGHTHAAQIRLFGWTPAAITFLHTDGRYDEGGQTLYVNVGLGCTAPFRLGANPEVTVITLNQK